MRDGKLGLFNLHLAYVDAVVPEEWNSEHLNPNYQVITSLRIISYYITSYHAFIMSLNIVTFRIPSRHVMSCSIA